MTTQEELKEEMKELDKKFRDNLQTEEDEKRFSKLLRMKMKKEVLE